MEERHETLFDEKHTEDQELVHVDFDLLDTQGRWFLKVLSGPNTGAEFSMQSGSSYLIGTDTNSCDIVFQDLSVSRQHARLSIDSQDRISIEDLNSRNGTFVEGEKLTTKRTLVSNSLISMGTTTFLLIDREGERQTIVSPIFNQSVEKKEEKKDENDQKRDLKEKLNDAVLPPIQSEVERIKEEEKRQARMSHAISTLVMLSILAVTLLGIGIGATMLFRTEEVQVSQETNREALIAKALQDFSQVRYSYNPTNGRLLLVGHVLNEVDRSKILDSLQDFKFISSIDSNNIVIDELVWKEANQVIGKTTKWRGITISSPEPGRFVMSGFLETRKQAEELYDYISRNFPYVDLLERRVLVEEEIQEQVILRLAQSGLRTIKVKLDNGNLILNGTIANGKGKDYNEVVKSIRAIPGIRNVESNVYEVAPDKAIENISDRYTVTGYSLQGNVRTVMIKGRLLMKGDTLDGMIITDIQPQVVLLEKDGIKYRIDFNS